MRRRNSTSRLRSRLASATTWLLNAILQDSVLRILRSSVVPVFLGLAGLGGAATVGTGVDRDVTQISRSTAKPACRDEVADEVTRLAEGSKRKATPAPRPPTEPQYTTLRLSCTDQQGNSGDFELVAFSRAFSWTLSSEEEVQLNAKEADFQAQLTTPGMADFLQAPRVIAVGMASCEGYPEHRDREIERAGRRARQLLAWIEAVRHPRDSRREHVPLQALNLGVYAKPCGTTDTWEQRRIVLLALYEADPGLSVRDCLNNALRNEPDLQALATDYEPGLGPNQTFVLRNR